MIRPDTDDYHSLFLNDIPLLDVRAPCEYIRGAFPNASNVPIIDNSQRQQIGTCYKRQGQAAAIQLGHRLVNGEVRQQRVRTWVEFVNSHPHGYLYCFRGGLRSQTACQWLAEQGHPYPLIAGGYKAMRRFLINTLEETATGHPLLVLAGKTGVGKTDLLQQLPHKIDLEALAHHRGSSFGRLTTPQPGQIDFENALAIECLKQTHRSRAPIVLEDESRMIGRCAIPLALRQTMQHAPLLILEAPMEERIERILAQYVIERLGDILAQQPDQPFHQLEESLLGSVDRIRKRLGGQAHQEIRQQMTDALKIHARTNEVEAHRVWIRRLLDDYYDPMYDYQLSTRRGRIRYQGSASNVLDWVLQYAAETST